MIHNNNLLNKNQDFAEFANFKELPIEVQSRIIFYATAHQNVPSHNFKLVNKFYYQNYNEIFFWSIKSDSLDKDNLATKGLHLHQLCKTSKPIQKYFLLEELETIPLKDSSIIIHKILRENDTKSLLHLIKNSTFVPDILIFHWLVSLGEKEEAKAIFKKNPFPIEKREDCFIRSIEYGYLPIANYLQDKIELNINPLVFISILENNNSIPKKLIGELPDQILTSYDNLLLRLACEYGDLNLAKYLISKVWIASFNDEANDGLSSGYNLIEIEKGHCKLDGKAKNHAGFRLAVQNGHTEIVRYLLDRRLMNPAHDNNICLKIAYLNGHKEIVNLLVKNKNVNPKNESLEKLLVLHYVTTQPFPVVLNKQKKSMPKYDETTSLLNRVSLKSSDYLELKQGNFFWKISENFFKGFSRQNYEVVTINTQLKKIVLIKKNDDTKLGKKIIITAFKALLCFTIIIPLLLLSIRSSYRNQFSFSNEEEKFANV
ncbi:MAG: hypothetical protein BGO10_06535 [Chlamydia sp. 32-24]|nr:MAG: hypothetical protein BGO10_06535 [Chlamydia sp. 32-24]